ncbi:hypothetical protein EW026_g4306 [Hermanssonia centrifuga]|uniref:Vacuolar protein sorting-associated protein 54 C-terminal domain-containing protein n=1 Tax=Hermanssonia centrifuga TaxID=98765 RepID=A0A4S4KIE8_9APHY|nr:hypothetical protein EW026_g4306 [Hermanssonia centrifuga]
MSFYNDILSSAGELANARAAKVITVRADQHTALDLHSFWTLFNAAWDFVVQSESVSRKHSCKTFHQARLSQSAKLVEDEQWNPVEVPPAIQHLVNLLVDASFHDPPEFKLSALSDPTSPLPPPSPLLPNSPALQVNGAPIQPSSPVPSPLMPPNTPKHLQADSKRRGSHTPGKHLKIEERNFFAVSATLEVLALLSDYMRVIVNLPSLVTDTMSRIIELLKAFNSRTCQVVLGAGAMRSAGLKNITAKHLALASQSLSIMISLVPYVRETFRRHLSQKQAVMLVEFDKLKRDYQEHQNEIHAKLIAIMGDRLSAHIRTLQAVRWDIAKQGGGVNDYMELLVKETVTLHKVLSRYLSLSIVEYVMTQVFAAINHRLSEEYAGIDLPSQESKERLLADAKFLHEKLSALKNVRAPTAMLTIVVQEKRIEHKSPPPAPALNAAPAPHSRFSTIFSRTETLKVPPTTTPAPTFSPSVNSEKALPVLSPSPDPSSISPTPPVFSDGTPTPPVNGHTSEGETAVSLPLNDAVVADGLVEEPQQMDDADESLAVPVKEEAQSGSRAASPLLPSPSEDPQPQQTGDMHLGP